MENCLINCLVNIFCSDNYYYPIVNLLGVKPGLPILLLPSQPPRQEKKRKGVKKPRKEKERSRYKVACKNCRTKSTGSSCPPARKGLKRKFLRQRWPALSPH